MVHALSARTSVIATASPAVVQGSATGACRKEQRIKDTSSTAAIATRLTRAMRITRRFPVLPIAA
ncbi:MAG: hypothetical protein IPG35_15115 [Flavobacteriales bacterium]|nr:hypothetical protein [Flavobacteriales bacterium]